MTLSIRAVRDKGIPEKERLVLAADAQEDIGKYVLFNTTYEDDDSVSSEVRHSFWLPDYKVNAGDLVVVYTKESTVRTKEKINDDKTKTVFIYWGVGGTVWDAGRDCAVLLKIDEWSFKRV